MQLLAQAVGVKPLQHKTEDETRSAVNSILQDPRISARISHDHREAGYISHPNASYLGAYVEDRLVGVFVVIDSGFVEVDLHVALKPEAIQHARDLGRACLDHVFTRDQDLARATAYVIEGLESACNYCLKLGFKREGFRRDACMKGGRLVGVHVLGITRAEWEATR